MNRERYINYTQPTISHVEMSDEQLFDEVDFIATHRVNIGATIGERAMQLTNRMRLATQEQEIRYNIGHK